MDSVCFVQFDCYFVFQVSQDVSGSAPGGEEVVGVVLGGRKMGRRNSKGVGKERKSRITSQDWTVYMNTLGGDEEQ